MVCTKTESTWNDVRTLDGLKKIVSERKIQREPKRPLRDLFAEYGGCRWYDRTDKLGMYMTQYNSYWKRQIYERVDFNAWNNKLLNYAGPFQLQSLYDKGASTCFLGSPRNTALTPTQLCAMKSAASYNPIYPEYGPTQYHSHIFCPCEPV